MTDLVDVSDGPVHLHWSGLKWYHMFNSYLNNDSLRKVSVKITCVQFHHTTKQ